MLISESEDNQTEPHELSSQAAIDLTSALASDDTLPESDSPPAEPSHLVTESTDLLVPLSEPSSSPSPPMGALSLPVESPEPSDEPSAEPPVPAEDPPCPPPVDLLQSSAVSEAVEDADDSPAQAVEDATRQEEESAEPLDVASAHHCSHDSVEEEPVESPLE